MSSGQLSITFPVRVGAQVAAVYNEVLKQLNRSTKTAGRLDIQACIVIHLLCFRSLTLPCALDYCKQSVA